MRVPDLLLKAAQDYDRRPRQYECVYVPPAIDEKKLTGLMNARRAAGWHFEGSLFDLQGGPRLIFSQLAEEPQ